VIDLGAAGPVHPEQVFADPHQVAEHLLNAGIYGLIGAEVKFTSPDLVVFWLTLEPWLPMAELGYPTERVALNIWRDETTAAVPSNNGGRTWMHRQPRRLGDPNHLGELCLWDPKDPVALRWIWRDGLVQLVTIIHRHLLAEEFARRNDGEWPSEDAPHGEGPHPIRTDEVRKLLKEHTR
jgi:hypothetical protein